MPELLWNRAPATPVATLVLAHGAGAPMDSPFMATMAGLLAERGIEVARFEFAYMARRREEGIKAPPDRAPRLMACFQAVLDEVRRTAPGPVWVGGKSMGGRMATMLAADPDTAPDGCVVFGYPFHPPGKPEKTRLDHFPALAAPVLTHGVYDLTILTALTNSGADAAPRLALPALCYALVVAIAVLAALRARHSGPATAA